MAGWGERVAGGSWGLGREKKKRRRACWRACVARRARRGRSHPKAAPRRRRASHHPTLANLSHAPTAFLAASAAFFAAFFASLRFFFSAADSPPAAPGGVGACAPCGEGAVEHLGSVGGTRQGRVGAEAVNRWELLKEHAAHGLGSASVDAHTSSSHVERRVTVIIAVKSVCSVRQQEGQHSGVTVQRGPVSCAVAHAVLGA